MRTNRTFEVGIKTAWGIGTFGVRRRLPARLREDMPRRTVEVWSDPRCGGRLVTRGRLLGELVALLLAGDRMETVRAFAGGVQASDCADDGRLTISLVGTTTEGELVYFAVAEDRPGSAGREGLLDEMRRECRRTGGTLEIWTRSGIPTAREGMRSSSILAT